MADIVEKVRLVLAADGIVSGMIAKRIYQDRLPQAMTTLPAIAIEEVSGVDLQDLGGDIVLMRTRVRCKCYAATPTEAASCRTAVVNVLATYRGEMGEQFVNEIELAGKGNGIDPPIAGTDTWRPHKFQDFLITHRAPAA